MAFFTREQRYEMLKGIKQGKSQGSPLTKDEEQFIQDYALEKLNSLLEDPEVMAAFRRMKDR